LRKLKDTSLDNIQINFQYFDLDEGFSTYTSGRRAGLQISDACASALFNAFEINKYGFKESRYLENLSPLLYRFRGNLFGYGIKIFPKEAIFEIKKDSELNRILEKLG
jgi:hypothetical protein